MLKPGMVISDRYEIIDKVGSGGMADVYKAKDQRLNRFVAIKVLKPEYSSDKSFVNKFRGEAQSAAGLSHPNIVNVYDVGDDSGLHYIVMELVEGITLKRFIERKGKLEVKEAVGISIQIAQGMEAAHDNHIIHRDIKPQNIIISRDGKVKVTDFGIAKATNSNTITSNAMGSVHYLSPEQARGGYSDEKSDIYSLGVTLYEMLSGKVPFAGDNTVSVALLHIQGEAMPLRELDPEIPVSVDKIVQKCMQKRPERRYHTASELIADLKRAISNPDGDFVQIPAFVASDSPTINISNDDLGRIKSGTFHEEDDLRPTKNLQAAKIAEDEDEDLDTVDSKVEKFFLIGSIAAAVILGIVIIVLVAWFLASRGGGSKPDDNTGAVTTESPTPGTTVAPTGTSDETYKVPNVLGSTFEDAKDTFEELDPDVFIKREDDQYSDTYDEGEVMEQYPDAGNDRTMGSTIILTVSKGKEPLQVPNLYGLTEENAEIKLTEKNLKMETEHAFNDEIEKGRVISTVPDRGTEVTSGDTVKVIISDGPENKQVAVPDISNRTEKEAKTILKEKGLELGEITYEPSDLYKEGKVFYQDYSVGTMVDPGTKIDVSVSTGPQTRSYIGWTTIDVNPFEYYEDGESLDIIFELEQDGQKEDIFQGSLSESDFPYPLTDIVSDSPSVGTIRMYVNGELFKLPGDQDTSWDIEFEPMED
jgi:eukaryotic-like serine/threonine-protein kinase